MATPVEATSAPKLHEVVDELQSCHGDWYLIGVYLKLSAAELDTVEANNPKVVMRFTRMITRWLKNKTNPSWSDLVRALRKIKEHALADRIAAKYCQREEHQPKQPSIHDASEMKSSSHIESVLQPQLEPPNPLASMSPQDLSLAPLPAEEDARLENLNERELCNVGLDFSFMFVTVSRVLNPVVPVDTLKCFLSSFRHPNSRLQYVSPQLYGHCKTTADVLKALEPVFINAMHPYLLRKIVEKFGCDNAKRAVEAYDVNFPWTVALKDLGDPLPEWLVDACPGAKRLRVVVKKNADTLSRQDLETFQTSLQNSLQIDRVVIVFAKLEPANSVALIFLVPECVSVVGSLRNDGQKLMDLASSGIMRIEAEGETIVVEVEGKLWMHRMMRMKDSDELSVDSGFGGSIVSSRRSSFSEEVPSDAPTRGDEEALRFAADLTANRTTPRREFYRATISDRAAAALGDGLSNNHSLRELKLDRCYISPVGVAALATALSSNTFLKTLRLQNCKITDDSMVELSQALLQNETLEELDLGNPHFGGNNNTITHLGASSLSKALLSNESLKTLNLWGNKIADQDVCSIAEALHGNETLQSLNLGENNISPQGATALAKLLETNRSIKTLNLWGNVIADQGVCAIADALHGNVTLQRLDLRYNNNTDVGILALSAVLPTNKSLQHLVLSFSDIFGGYRGTDEGVRQLASGLEGSTSLKTLKLLSTRHISRKTMKILRDSAQRKEIELIILN